MEKQSALVVMLPTEIARGSHHRVFRVNFIPEFRGAPTKRSNTSPAQGYCLLEGHEVVEVGPLDCTFGATGTFGRLQEVKLGPLPGNDDCGHADIALYFLRVIGLE